MVTEWDRTAARGARAPHAATGRASLLSRLFDFFWSGGAERRLAAEPIDDHLLRDIGLTRHDINVLSRVPKRRS